MRDLLDFPLKILRNVSDSRALYFCSIFAGKLTNFHKNSTTSVSFFFQTQLGQLKNDWLKRYDSDFVPLKIHWQINVVSWQMQTNRMNSFEMWNLGQTTQRNAHNIVKISRKTHEKEVDAHTNIQSKTREKFYCVGQTNSIKKVVGLFVSLCFSFNMLLARSFACSQHTNSYIISA